MPLRRHSGFIPRAVSRTLNSLFKVLFNFPSRYLFAIGLVTYLALDGVYHPLWAAIPNNPTLGTILMNAVLPLRALHPLWARSHNQVDLRQLRRSVRTEPYTTFPSRQATRIRFWAFPSSLAATKGILVSFFSSAY